MPPLIGANLRVTGNCNQGGRKYMEDVFCVAYQETQDRKDLEYAFSGIFDGHGGLEAAVFAKENLMRNIVIQEGFWSDSDEDICNAIKGGFIATHYAMWKKLDSWPKTQSGLPSTSGTTASIVFIKNSKIYVGHVGDSGVILGKEDSNGELVANVLTQDHKPELPAELERIHAAGGQVTIKAGIHRVVWQRPKALHHGPMTRSTHIDYIPFLAVARSLGDLWSYNADSDQFIVSPIPDVSVHPIDTNIDRCIILGTDGLFNMLSGQEAVEIVAEAERNNFDCLNRKGIVWYNPAKYLVDHAITKWMDTRLRADNTSAVVILLDALNSNERVPTDIKPGYTIEEYKVKDGKCTKKSELINEGTKWKIPSVLAKTTSIAKDVTLKEITEHYSKSPFPLPSEETIADDSAQLLQDISLEDDPNRQRNKKTIKRQKKKRPPTPTRTVGRRKSFMCDRASASAIATSSATAKPIRTRRTRSEEPVRTKTRCGMDAENAGAPMRLRSTTPFKTLRSRNVNLKTPFYEWIVEFDETLLKVMIARRQDKSFKLKIPYRPFRSRQSESLVSCWGGTSEQEDEKMMRQERITIMKRNEK